MKEVLEFLQKAGTFYLATVDGDQPRVRPFGAVCEFEGKLYITTANTKDVYKQMVKNPKIEISAMTDDGKWIRLAGEVVTDDRDDARVAMLEANPNLKNMYSIGDGKFEVLYFKNATATICSFTDAPVTCTF
ncbi:MAG: pyridoxamine 5'-phosphate oxidase family protein [Lachnospiraceae bacterium]|nr:pyridoxamine 5'-phosphate oxidase family protein [Lachnospiraceae bacterium]